MLKFAQFIKEEKSFTSALKEEITKGVSAKAQKAESDAYNALLKSTNAKSLVAPAGFDAGFPDFAYRLELQSGKTVDVHLEYKADAKAQMGSMRDWVFDGRQFSTPDTKSESKQELIFIMNNTPVAIENGKRLLNDLKAHFSPKVTKIYSGSLTVIADKDERRIQTQNFASNTKNYQVAQIVDASLGDKIIQHYKNKFHKNLKSGSDASILLMMLKDSVWLVDEKGSLTTADMQEVAKRFGLTKFTKLENLSAKLEVRIQPRGLSSGKPTSIDVMASFRLNGAPSNGGKVI